MRTAALILNRNLPQVTDALCEHLQRYDPDTDIFVIESGSDDDKLSKYATWHADWPDARREGLRYYRGMNFGLSSLWKDGSFSEYDAFLLLANDTELENKPTVAPLCAIMELHPHVGILSPCAESWGEYQLLNRQKTRYFWYIQNNAYFIRRKFIEQVCNREQPDMMHFLFDGENFRGYGSESELIAKGYINNWASAITSEVMAGENETYLLSYADAIKTEPFEENQKLYLEEGLLWMRHKFGFSSRWMMQEYVRFFYENFFKFNPECMQYKL